MASYRKHSLRGYRVIFSRSPNLALNSLPIPQNRTWQVDHVLLFTFYLYKGNCSYLCSSLPVIRLYLVQPVVRCIRHFNFDSLLNVLFILIKVTIKYMYYNSAIYIWKLWWTLKGLTINHLGAVLILQTIFLLETRLDFFFEMPLMNLFLFSPPLDG